MRRIVTDANPEQLRQRIAQAIIPLLGEYETLTMAQIARAAGIGEAELQAVFANKEAVMQASVSAIAGSVTGVLDPAGEVQKIRAIHTDQPLTSRLVKVIEILDAYNRRVRAELEDLVPVSTPVADTPGDRTLIPQDEIRSLSSESPEIQDAVAKLLEPNQHHLRLPPQVLAAAFVGMSFGGIRPAHPGQPPLPAEQIVDLFLNGALDKALDA